MKTTNRILCAVLALLLCLPCLALAEEIPTVVTIVHAPEQTQAERPTCFADPTENYIPLPESENLAKGKPVKAAGTHTDVYVISNINDGKTDTYWESKGFPAEVTFDLGAAYQVCTVALCLNPSAIWEPRQQEIAVLVSMDGETFTEAAAPALLQFDAETGNRVRIDFDAVEAAFVRVVISKNTAQRTGGAQAAEICIYAQE